MLMILFVLFQQMGSGNNQALGFGKSKAKLYGDDKQKVRFDDIAGNESAKQDLEEVVDFLKNPEKLQKIGRKGDVSVVLEIPAPFRAISQVYENWHDVQFSGIGLSNEKAFINSPTICSLSEALPPLPHTNTFPFSEYTWTNKSAAWVISSWTFSSSG